MRKEVAIVDILDKNEESLRLIKKFGFKAYTSWTGRYGGLPEPQTFLHFYLDRNSWKRCTALLSNTTR
jgi:hypothetical protein